MVLATPVAAHPGSLWGIDLTSVLSMRDQTRIIAHHHHEGDADDEQDLVDSHTDDLEQVRTVVIDPGHGGDNSGAFGIAGIPEKRLTLELAFQLREELQEKYPRLRVVMTRYWDASVDLDERARIANLANADLFISLHYNAAAHDRAVGFETYFLSADEASLSADSDEFSAPIIDGAFSVGQADDAIRLIEHDLLRVHSHELSAELAEAIQSRLVRHIDSVNRGVKQGNFAVLREAQMPAVVVEAGFMTHPEEGIEILTDDHQSLVITALMEAIEDFDALLVDQLDVDDPDETDDADDADDEPVAEGLTLR